MANAARDAGITISPYIMKSRKPRSGPATKRATKVKKEADGRANTLNDGGDDEPPVQTHKLPSEMLLSLFDSEMEKEEQDAIWTLIKYHKAKGK